MSAKYVIDRSKFLGQGSTAVVFLGIRMEDGCQVALKCSKDMLEQEISTMKELEHKNIIKYYESLFNFDGYERVIVMEYCNKGSLYEFIELHRGLCDNMFMKVLECMNGGVSYLREKGIMHRDIKPGNMMVHQDNMGYYHVKLGDMGSAKKVLDGQYFMSLVGTEEYLHPDMYISSLRKIKGNFTIKADLWSIGVTLYHAAVTQLPFMPYRYYRNSKICKETLRKMYVEKKPGIISGRQNSERENDITWSDQLPSTCRFSTMLKDLSSKLICNLMDLSESNSYERFFKEADNILQKKRLLLFNSLSAELQIIYLDNISYSDVLNHISKMMKLPKEEVMILTRNKQLERSYEVKTQCLRPLSTIRGHMKYTLTDDTALVITTKSNMKPLPLLSPYHSLANFDEPSVTYTDVDSIKRYSNDLIQRLYKVSSSANHIDCQRDCYLATVFSFNEHVLRPKLLMMYESLPWQIQAIRDLCLMSDSLVKIVEEVIKYTKDCATTQRNLTTCKEEIEQLRSKGLEGEKCGEQYYSSILEKQKMLKYTEKNFCNNDDVTTNDNLDFLIYLAEEAVNELKRMSLEKFQKPDDFKLEIWRRQVKLLKFYEESKEMFLRKSKSLQDMHKSFNKWLNQGLSVMGHVDGLRDFFCRLDDRRLALRTKFLHISDFLLKILVGPNLEGNAELPPITNFEEKSVLTSRIMELKELTEKMKTKFCLQKS